MVDVGWGTLVRSPGQHSKRIKVELQGLLRARLGNHITSLLLHFTGHRPPTTGNVIDSGPHLCALKFIAEFVQRPQAGY